MTICCFTRAGQAFEPAFDDDITNLLRNLPALPSLRAVSVRAVSRCVGPVDVKCIAHLHHLALACTELTLSAAGDWDPPKGKGSSLYVAVMEPEPDTVGVARRGYLCCSRFAHLEGLRVNACQLLHV